MPRNNGCPGPRANNNELLRPRFPCGGENVVVEAGSKVKVRELAKRDAKKAGEFCQKNIAWMWKNYLMGVYPEEAKVFEVWHWSEANLLKALKQPEFFGFMAECRGKICGIVLGMVHGKSGFAMVNWIAVDPEHQHEGIGIKLMMAMEEHVKKRGCHKVSLHTLPALVPAVRLYMKFGLLPEAFLRQQWWGADFIMMSKWIGKYSKH